MMDYIKISGFKSIREIDLELKPINILIGANGSGKSNFISFFEFLNKLYDRKLTEYIALKGGEEKMLHKGNKVTSDIVFETSFENGTNGYLARLVKGDEELVFQEEYLICKGNKGRNIATYRNENFLKPGLKSLNLI